MFNITISMVLQFIMNEYGITNIELCLLEEYIHTFIN